MLPDRVKEKYFSEHSDQLVKIAGMCAHSFSFD